MSWFKAEWFAEIEKTLVGHLPTVGVALALLVGGWLAAFVVQRLVHAALRKTTIDDHIARWLGVDTGGEQGDRIERLVARSVYYVCLSFVFVAFFSYLKIDAVTRPLLTVLNGIAEAVPHLAKAIVLGGVGFGLALIVRRLILFVLSRVGFDERMAKMLGEAPEPPPEPTRKKKGAKDAAPQLLSKTVADVAYWFVVVVAAIPVLESLKIGVLAQPLSAAFGTITTYLPKIGGAAVLLVVGYVLSRVARAFVSGLSDKLGVDRAMAHLGLGRALKGQSVGKILGTIAMAFVLLQFAISAVGRLQIDEISRPLGKVLEQVYGYFPKLLVGTLLMAVGVVIGKLIGNIAARLLAAMGFNTLMVHIGLFTDDASDGARQETEAKRIAEERAKPAAAEAGAPTSNVDEDDLLAASTGIHTPADVAGLVVSTIVILLFARQVLGTLQLEGLALLLDRLVAFLPNVVIAGVLVGSGLWAGRWAHRRIDELTAASQDRLARSLGNVARGVIVTFTAMMALQQLGVGSQLIAIAFGLVLGSVCLALALAFGLGGRDTAARIVAREYERRRTDHPPR